MIYLVDHKTFAGETSGAETAVAQSIVGQSTASPLPPPTAANEVRTSCPRLSLGLWLRLVGSWFRVRPKSRSLCHGRSSPRVNTSGLRDCRMFTITSYELTIQSVSSSA